MVSPPRPGSPLLDAQPPLEQPRTPNVQRDVPSADQVHSTPFNKGTATQHGEPLDLQCVVPNPRPDHSRLICPSVEAIDPLLKEDLAHFQRADLGKVLTHFLSRVSTSDGNTSETSEHLLLDALGAVERLSHDKTILDHLNT